MYECTRTDNTELRHLVTFVAVDTLFCFDVLTPDRNSEGGWSGVSASDCQQRQQLNNVLLPLLVVDLLTCFFVAVASGRKPSFLRFRRRLGILRDEPFSFVVIQPDRRSFFYDPAVVTISCVRRIARRQSRIRSRRHYCHYCHHCHCYHYCHRMLIFRWSAVLM